MLRNKVILLTGGTGSFGNKFTEMCLKTQKPKAIRIFSRDELKQWEMERRFGNDPRLRFLVGDIRDKERVERAMDGVDVVVHAAALKQVPACEYNPFEAIKTNIIGAENILNAAIDHEIESVLAVSTDKAVNPVNLYGATKMCMEKIIIAANSYTGERVTKFSCVRYGNLVGSRGSVVPVFMKQRESGTLTVTDERMTRFWITLEDGVNLVFKALNTMKGGEIYIPKIASMGIMDLAKTIAPECKVKFTGIRSGEKLHECLLTDDEARHSVEFDDHFVIEPEFHWWTSKKMKGGKQVKENFRYSSDTNTEWLNAKQLKAMMDKA
jgi:UDP-N-acetylglucosamine 4,6-dehydratase